MAAPSEQKANIERGHDLSGRMKPADTSVARTSSVAKYGLESWKAGRHPADDRLQQVR